MISHCFDTEKDCGEGIHHLLFVVRESVQESLGFRPFELVFGHTVGRPLKLLKEKFLSQKDTPLNLLQNVSDFRSKLLKACEATKLNLKRTQGQMKQNYDTNTKERSFKSRDKVLALLPVPGRPLQARYFGPYTVEKKANDLNYIITTSDRRKQRQLCHISMLKEYVDRDSSDVAPVNDISIVPQKQSATRNVFREKLMPPTTHSIPTFSFPPVCFTVQIFSLWIHFFKFDLCKHKYFKSFFHVIINSACHNYIYIKVLSLSTPWLWKKFYSK